MYSFQVFGTRRIGVFVNSLNGHLSCNPVVGEFIGVSLLMSFLNQYLCLVFIQKLSPGIKKKNPLNSFILVFTWYLSFSLMDPGLVGAGHGERKVLVLRNSQYS